NPDRSKLLTPRAGAIDLTVSTGDIEPWSTLPPGLYQGSFECARYDSTDSMLRAFGCRTLAEFKAASRGFRWWAEENVIIDGTVPRSANTIKLTSIFPRIAGMTRAKFLERYPGVHAPLVRKTPELPRYVQNYIRSDDEARFDLEFDAVAELWW